MRAIDTHILKRYFREDDVRQSPAAVRVMAASSVICPKTVVLEFVWVMRHVYQHDAGDILRCLRMLLSLANVTIEDEQQIAQAVDDDERGIDFADALCLAASHRCDDLAAFDNQRFAKRIARLRRKPPVIVPQP
jgi:predicted nucleic-acid-binding protein